VRALLRRFPDSLGTVRPAQECRRRFEQMKHLLGLPPSFGFLLEAYGPYPKGRSQAVSWLAIQIAMHMGLSQAEIEEIRLGGLLHDIGKSHVPLRVLNKSALLTTEEFEVMKSHAARGEQMLEPLKMKAIGRIVHHPHERYDGKGYPDGLAEDKIPLGRESWLWRSVSKIWFPTCLTRVPAFSMRLLPNCAIAHERSSTRRS